MAARNAKLRASALAVAACGVLLGWPGTAGAADVTVDINGSVVVNGANDPTANTMTVQLSGPNQITVTDTSTVPTSPDLSCSIAADTATCNVTTVEIRIQGSPNGNTFTVVGNIPLTLDDAGDGNDTVFSGAGNDFLHTGPGIDDVHGGDGSDQLFNEAGVDTFDGQEGGDVVDAAGFLGVGSADGDIFTDTGTTGVDSITYSGALAGVDLHIDDGLANDGTEAGTEGDTIGPGFETIGGSEFDDGIFGSAAAETLLGGFGDGDDDIVGGAGADSLVGGDGVDNLIATDGVADSAIDCGPGLGDTAAIDTGIDPAPVSCENVQGPGPGPNPDPGPGPGPGPGPNPNPDPTPDPDPSGPIAVPVSDFTTSLIRARMPGVVGTGIDDARAKIAKAFPGVAFELNFVKSCGKLGDLEVTEQSPAGGKKVSGTAASPVVAKLTACLGSGDYLKDCDTSDLKTDLKDVAGKLDGGLALALGDKLSKCKVDYDVKISNAAAEAAKLTAQKQTGTKPKAKAGEIKLAMQCPAEGDLIVSVGEGFKTTDTRVPSFGLRVNGTEDQLWTLPSPFQNDGTRGYRAFVSLTVKDVAGQWPEVSAIVDDDEINPFNKKTDRYESRLGVITIPVTAVNPGSLRICVFQETSSGDLLTKSIELRVIEGPAGGSNEIYKTAGGRYIQFGDEGPVEIDADQGAAQELVVRESRRPAARNLFGCLADLWGCVSSLFNGTSKTINQLDGDGTISRPKKVKEASARVQLGVAQIAMGPRLAPYPGTPVILTQPCLVVFENVVYSTHCPVITAPNGTALVGANFGAGAPGLVAAGGGNVLSHNGGQIVAAGAGNMVAAGAGNLIGADGASLIGADGASIVAAGGLNASNGIVAAGGLNAIQPDTAGIVAAGGLNLIGADGASIVAAGAGNLIGADGASIVAAGGLN